MASAQVDALERMGRRVRVAKGSPAFRAGDPGDSIVFILRGEVEVYVATESRREVRLATLGPGSSCGELAMLSEPRRTAGVRAASGAECLEVRFDDLDAAVKTKLLLDLGAQLVGRLEREARELRQLG
jgi:CRP-like cAMP-binding protein